MATDVKQVLKERGTRYGKFSDHSDITQSLKKIIASGFRARHTIITNSMQEALDMICHKIGRIVNGDPGYADSWVDIAGYAMLVANELEQGVEKHAVATGAERNMGTPQHSSEPLSVPYDDLPHTTLIRR